MLKDIDGGVQYNALETLAKLEAAVLGQHADAIVRQLDPDVNSDRDKFYPGRPSYGTTDDGRYGLPLPTRQGGGAPPPWSGSRVRLKALAALGKMDAATLAKHTEAVAAKFKDSEGDVRFRARLVMHKIEPAAGHLAAVLEGLQDRTFEQEPHDYPGQGRLVCVKAVQALGTLEAAALAPHGHAITKILDDERYFVKALGELQAAVAPAVSAWNSGSAKTTE